MSMQQADREVTGMMNKKKSTIMNDDGLVKDILAILREQKKEDDAIRAQEARLAAKAASKDD